MMGSHHAENLARHVSAADLVAVADADPQRAHQVAARLGVERWFGDPHDLLASRDVDAVVIATPDETHAAMVMAAAEAGKDILCEKPLATTLTDADRALAAVAAARVRLQIGFMRRYDPAYAAAKAALDAGQLGRPALFRGIHRNPQVTSEYFLSNPAAPYTNSMIHDFDNALWFLGSDATEVMAFTSNTTGASLPANAFDTALVDIRFASGALATIELSLMVGYAYEVRAELIGTAGAALMRTAHPNSFALLRAGEARAPISPLWREYFADAYRLEMVDWVQRMRDDQPPAVTGEDGRRALVLAHAAFASERARRPLRVDVIKGTVES
jgi:scyllo-inositol 2-dehydrogenase (NAD+)